MEFEKIAVPTTKELLLRQIEEKIISGELPVGTRLPTEREMAEQMGVTKSVLHFALKDLESMRFLRTVPRQGTYVNDWVNHGSFETLNAVLKLRGSSADANFVTSLIDMRNVIEADAMLLCAARCTENDFAQLQESIDALASLPPESSPEDQAREVKRFHYLLVQKSGNVLYPLMMNAFEDFAMILWSRCVTHWTKDVLVGLEQKQLYLIRSGRADEAGQMLKDMFTEYLRVHGKPY